MSLLQQVRGRYSVQGNPLQTQRRVELVAVIATLLLLAALIVGGLRLSSLGLPDSRGLSADSLTVAPAGSIAAASAEQRAAIKARPLFWQSRRAQEPVKAKPAGDKAANKGNKAKGGDLSKVQLLGVFGGKESAGIIAVVEGEQRRVLLGEPLLGWSLQSIEYDRAVFKDKARTRDVFFSTPRSREKKR